MDPMFKMRARENALKERISQMRERELKLLEREKEFEYLKSSLLTLRTSQSGEEEMPVLLSRKKSSRDSEQSRNNDK